MTPEERATTYAYCLVNQAKDFLDTAYRCLSGDGYGRDVLKDLPEIRKAFVELDIPMDELAAAFRKEMSRITDFGDKDEEEKHNAAKDEKILRWVKVMRDFDLCDDFQDFLSELENMVKEAK